VIDYLALNFNKNYKIKYYKIIIMIIHIEGFDQNNNFINKYINIQNKKLKELKGWTCYDWFKDGFQLDDEYNDWKDNDNYEIIFNNRYINLYIKINNKLVMSPLISITSTIEELKDILSIKDNIYFKQIKLKDNKTLDDYGINNMETISVMSNIYSSPSLEC